MRVEHTAPGGTDETTIRIAGLERPLTLVQITDSHLTEVDARDTAVLERGLQLSAEFLKRSPDGIPTRELFRQALARSVAIGADAVVLTGDIIHFPSQANLEAVRSELAVLALPCLYTPGNHDWHFPHLEWSDATRALAYPLLAHLTAGDPAMQARDIGGVRLVAIDNSTYQVSEQQLAFLRAQLTSGLPCLLFVHIPFFLPSLAPDVVATWQAPIMMAAPGWTDATRDVWRVRDADASTRQCYELVMKDVGDNLVGIFCGHVHFAHADALRPGRMQYVTRPEFAGGYRVIRLLPMQHSWWTGARRAGLRAPGTPSPTCSRYRGAAANPPSNLPYVVCIRGWLLPPEMMRANAGGDESPCYQHGGTMHGAGLSRRAMIARQYLNWKWSVARTGACVAGSRGCAHVRRSHAHD